MLFLRLILCCLCLLFACEQVLGQSLVLTEIPLAQCIRYHDDGNTSVTDYDVCTSFCCGGIVVDNSTNQECCGSIEFGSPYDPNFQHCCQWWTGHGLGHVRSYQFEQIGCCGAQRINWGFQSCCYGYPDPPEVFRAEHEMCCNSRTLPLPNGVPRHYTQCCGRTATYDRRFDSCPCDDGTIVNVTAPNSACCETPEGLKTPYTRDIELCCPNGRVGRKGEYFCCGETEIGKIGESVCCSGSLFPVVPVNVSFISCCNETAYNPDESLCCGNMVMDIIDGADQCCNGIPYNLGKSICCDNSLHSTENVGTECCGNDAFFPGKGSFCCNNDIFISADVGGNACCGDGEDTIFYFEDQMDFICCEGLLGFRGNHDACCRNTSYSTVTSICCEGEVFSKLLGDACCNRIPYFTTTESICCPNGPFSNAKTPRCCGGDGFDIEGGQVCCGSRVFGRYKWPACCVDEGYDAFTHVCCGAVIYPNPSGGNQGACCGNRAYDRGSQLCCSGENVTVPADIPMSRAQCCNFEVFNTDTQLCCSNTIRPKLNPFTTKCCGLQSYNTTDQICCTPSAGAEPELHDFEYGEENTACCDGTLFNTTAQYCCEGFLSEVVFENTGCCAGRAFNLDENICCENTLREIGTVPSNRAECCGDKCIFGGIQRCCQQRVYQNNMRTNNTCENF